MDPSNLQTSNSTNSSTSDNNSNNGNNSHHHHHHHHHHHPLPRLQPVHPRHHHPPHTQPAPPPLPPPPLRHQPHASSELHSLYHHHTEQSDYPASLPSFHHHTHHHPSYSQDPSSTSPRNLALSNPTAPPVNATSTAHHSQGLTITPPSTSGLALSSPASSTSSPSTPILSYPHHSHATVASSAQSFSRHSHPSTLPHHQLLQQTSPQHTSLQPQQRFTDQQRSNVDNYKSSANPAYTGYVANTHDALLIFTGCESGRLPRVTRRLHERERRSIKSGSIFVFDEREAGIKRWTDGRIWSPSRILNNFLVYREIDQKRPNSTTNQSTNPANSNPSSPSIPPNSQPHHHTELHTSVPPAKSHSARPEYPHNQVTLGESKPVIDRTPSTDNSLRVAAPQAESSPPNGSQPSNPAGHPSPNSQSAIDRDKERALVGSLTTTYKFREGGLVKKTISLGGMHLISYYNMEQVLSGVLRRPSKDPDIVTLPIPTKFLTTSSFRIPPNLYFGPNGQIWVREEEPQQPGPDAAPHTSDSRAPPSNTTSPPLHSSSTAATSAPTPRSASSIGYPNPPPFLNPPNSISSAVSQVATRLPQPLLNSSSASQPLRLPGAEPSGHNAPISRPTSASDSTGSPRPRSPATSPHGLRVTSSSSTSANLSQATCARSSYPRIQPVVPTSSGNTSVTGPARTSILNLSLGNSPACTSNSLLRYDPYPRPNRSPPTLSHLVATTTPSATTYYHHPTESGNSANFSSHNFLNEPHSNSLVSQQQHLSDRDAFDGSNSGHPDGRSMDESMNSTYGTARSSTGGYDMTDFTKPSYERFGRRD